MIFKDFLCAADMQLSLSDVRRWLETIVGVKRQVSLK